MNRGALNRILTVTLLGVVGLSLAAQEPSVIKPSRPKKGSVSAKATRNPDAKARAQAKVAARANRIDINSASKDDLKKIPGITEAIAAKIIAGRPYSVKTNLVTHNIVPLELFLTIRDRIMAKPKATIK